jgi:1-acyl-sn-glycerol-3-phosphate acyltransferase
VALIRLLLIVLLFRPIARLLTGADVTGREHLPLKGPAIIAANHASHVDTFLLLSVFPARALRHVRPAAAAEYFLARPVRSWFSRKIIGIVPVYRAEVKRGGDPMAPVREALKAGDIVVVFPEGTRGSGADLGPLKAGVAKLAAEVPEAPVIPVWIQGAGRVLPKGRAVPVPLTCSAHVGPPIAWPGDRVLFMETLRQALEDLHAQAPPLQWRKFEEPAA